MGRALIVGVALVGLTASWSLLAQETGTGQNNTLGVGSGASVADDRFGKLGTEFTPIARPEIAALPTPRLHDGRPDLSGPWVGGGSNNDIETNGGLKPGELPLLPWAKALRDSRKEEDEPYLYCTPMGIPRVNPYPWRFVQAYSAKGNTHIFVLHENGDGGAQSTDLHGRSQAPAGSAADMVGPFHRALGWRHARHRHRRHQ